MIATTATNLPTSNIDAVDPAIYDIAYNPQFTGLAYDALVNFQQSPGAAGLRLVPDLAVSIPRRATAAGRTRSRSDRDPLLRRPAATGRRFSPWGRAAVPCRIQGHSLYAGLVGAGACRRDPRTLQPPHGIMTNNAAGTVTFHFTAPDPEFLFQLTESRFSAPIPPGTPDHETGQRTVPGTGPYQIVSVSPNRDPVRPQPVLSRVVPRRPTRRQPQRDRMAHRAEPASRRNRGRAGTSRLALRPDPARPVPPARAPGPR